MWVDRMQCDRMPCLYNTVAHSQSIIIMSLVWINRGDGYAQETFCKPDGSCSLQHLGLDASSIALDGKLGFMESGCVFSLTIFRKVIQDVGRGSTSESAILVTGMTGMTWCMLPCFTPASHDNDIHKYRDKPRWWRSR